MAAAKHRILFASCNSQHYEADLWPNILARDASAFLWTGDVIYADDFEPRRGFGKPLPRPASPETFRKVYHEMMETDYKYVAGNMTVLGAWDDHGECVSECYSLPLPGRYIKVRRCMMVLCLQDMPLLFRKTMDVTMEISPTLTSLKRQSSL